MARTGRPPKGDRKGTTVRLPTETHQELKVFCALRGEDMSDILSAVIVEWWVKNTEREATQLAIKNAKKS